MPLTPKQFVAAAPVMLVNTALLMSDFALVRLHLYHMGTVLSFQNSIQSRIDMDTRPAERGAALQLGMPVQIGTINNSLIIQYTL